jgi:hypothetical protein
MWWVGECRPREILSHSRAWVKIAQGRAEKIHLIKGKLFKGKLLKKFSLEIPFKTFHASADVAASPAPSARIREKILEKGFQRKLAHK